MNKKQKAKHKARMTRRKARAQAQVKRENTTMLECCKTSKARYLGAGAVIGIGGGSYAFIPWFTEFVNNIWGWIVGLFG